MEGKEGVNLPKVSLAHLASSYQGLKAMSGEQGGGKWMEKMEPSRGPEQNSTVCQPSRLCTDVLARPMSYSLTHIDEGVDQAEHTEHVTA